MVNLRAKISVLHARLKHISLYACNIGDRIKQPPGSMLYIGTYRPARSNILSSRADSSEIIELQIFEDFKRSRDARADRALFESEAYHYREF